jgi:hypothetical protein
MVARRSSRRWLNQPSPRCAAVGADEAVQRRQLARRGDFEDGAVVVGSATEGCPVEVSMGGLHQPPTGKAPSVQLGLRTKAVKCGQLAHGGDFENRAGVVAPPLRLSRRSFRRTLNQRLVTGASTIRPVEIHQSSESGFCSRGNRRRDTE